MGFERRRRGRRGRRGGEGGGGEIGAEREAETGAESSQALRQIS